MIVNKTKGIFEKKFTLHLKKLGSILYRILFNIPFLKNYWWEKIYCYRFAFFV